MAKLDRLIEAMAQQSAEALVVAPGRQPSLVIGGESRPIAKNTLDELQVSGLVSEIAPPEARSQLLPGRETSFEYASGGVEVVIEWSRAATATIRRSATPSAGPATAGIPLSMPSDASTEAPPAAEAPAGESPSSIEVGELTMDSMFHALIDSGGSDLHVSSECLPMMRVDGDMAPVRGLPQLDAATAKRILLSIAPERNREEFGETGDTDFAYEIPGVSRFRCNLFTDRKGPGGVFRVIPSKIITAEDLDLSAKIKDLCKLSKGLVLVTGPTGSGKSTTLCALVDLINRTRSDHVITIEDPIEFVHDNKKCLINQREVHVHTTGFKKALRAALREDPDIVLVGEMRDLETIHIALETAETGHLVFGTLHTTSAVSTVDRIIDQFPADRQAQIRIMLSESLRGVIAQVLCKRNGGGRVAALEVLMVNAAVSNLIREGKTFQIPSIMQTGKKLGMQQMNDALLELVEKKLVAPEEALMKAIDKNVLLGQFKAKGIRVKNDAEVVSAS